MSFGDPTWLYLLPVALVIAAVFFWYTERAARRRLRRFVSARLLPELAAGHNPRRQILKLALVTAGAACALLALARPQLGYEVREATTAGVDVLVALDVSRSMLATDVAPNRLERAKLAVYDLLDAVEGDRIGLVSFAGTAFLQSPFTSDYGMFRQTLDMMDTDSIPIPGTDLSAAIRESRASFPPGDQKKLLFLISDGEDLEGGATSEATRAAEENIVIHTIGIGSADGELIPLTTPDGGRDYLRDSQGNPVRTRLDEATLREIANRTGGDYENLRDARLAARYKAAVAELERSEGETTTRRTPLERYQWPLTAAVFLLAGEWLISTRRRQGASRAAAIPIALMLLAVAVPQTAYAADSWRAQQLYRSGDYAESAEAYRHALDRDPDNARLHYNHGVSLFAAEQFAEATESFTRALRTDDIELQRDAYFNRGNSRYNRARRMHGEDPRAAMDLWLQSLQDFEAAHELDPSDSEAADRLHTATVQFNLHSGLLAHQAVPQEGGSVHGPEGRFLNGTAVELEAEPADGWRFAGWSGSDPEHPDEQAITHVVSGDALLRAAFVKVWKLDVAVDPEHAGTVREPGTFDDGTYAPIQALPSEGYRFDSWRGSSIAAIDRSSTRVYMDADRTVTAIFERELNLIVRPDNPEAGSTTGSGNYPPAEEIRITAEPAEGFEFSHWVSPHVRDPGKPETTVRVPPGEHDVIAVFDRDEEPDPESDDEQEESSGDQPEDGPGDSEEPTDPAEGSQEDTPADADGDEASETKSQETEPMQERDRDGMTPEEARRMLEALRRDEKLLPMGDHTISEDEMDRDRRSRDW